MIAKNYRISDFLNSKQRRKIGIPKFLTGLEIAD